MESINIAATAADVSDPRAGLRAVASLRQLADALELRQVGSRPSCRYELAEHCRRPGRFPAGGAQEIRKAN